MRRCPLFQTVDCFYASSDDGEASRWSRAAPVGVVTATQPSAAQPARSLQLCARYPERIWFVSSTPPKQAFLWARVGKIRLPGRGVVGQRLHTYYPERRLHSPSSRVRLAGSSGLEIRDFSWTQPLLGLVEQGACDKASNACHPTRSIRVSSLPQNTCWSLDRQFLVRDYTQGHKHQCPGTIRTDIQEPPALAPEQREEQKVKRKSERLLGPTSAPARPKLIARSISGATEKGTQGSRFMDVFFSSTTTSR